ncbi:MAG: phosphate uptake regulator PhoU [Phycisphaerales bacterium JB039]
MTVDDFLSRLENLKDRLVDQGTRVGEMIEDSFEALYDLDADAAATVAARDDEVDRVDVEIECACVALLTAASRSGASLDEADVRSLLTIVKVNNELERIADAAQRIATHVEVFRRIGAPFPPTLRVMTNSVIGIVRDATAALARDDADLARLVLQSEDTVEQFTGALLREADKQIATGGFPVEFAFHLHEAAHDCEVMADHATNIAEQVIYALTGAIVRHCEEGWKDVPVRRA